MTLEALFDRLETTDRELVVYTSERDADVAERFAAANADVEHRTLPGEDAEGFVVVRDERGFRGVAPLGLLRRMLDAPVPDPWDLEAVHGGHRALFDLLDGTLFVALDRRRLLVASREVEEHAWRVGAGTLCAGFQTAEGFRRQRRVYARLAEETVLDVHAYARSVPPDVPPGVTFHTEPAAAVRRFWFVAFDGSGDETRKCAVVGRQRDPETYAGFWTYHPETVDAVLEAVPTGR